MLRLAPIAAGALLFGCVSIVDRDRGQRSADQIALTQFRPVGEATSCVEIRRIRNTRVRDDRTIDFYMAGNRIYRNTLPYRCSGLKFEESFAYETSIGRLCSVDTISVRRSGGFLGPTCGLGRFQEIRTRAQ